jgi:hypothetical protein
MESLKIQAVDLLRFGAYHAVVSKDAIREAGGVAIRATARGRAPSREKQQIAGFFRPEEASALKRLAVVRGTTVRELMAKAFNLLLAADRAEHAGEDDPTRGIVFDEAPAPRGGAAHRRFVPPGGTAAGGAR